ncbi:MAG: hypothetical protein ACP5RP_01155 [Candidatus Micrarchaeia archaeon]
MASEFVYMYEFDAGISFNNDIYNIFKNPEKQAEGNYAKPEPTEFESFYRPHIFNMGKTQIKVKDTWQEFRIQVAFYDFGGISIRLRLTIDRPNSKIVWELGFGKETNEEMDKEISKIKNEIEKHISKIGKLDDKGFYENYKFYYIEEKKNLVLGRYKGLIAGLLINEKEANTLDKNYVEQILSRKIEYDLNNIVFVGWESTFMIDRDYSHEHELTTAEIANLQLLEMRLYHKNLVQRISNASKVLSKINTTKILNNNRYIVNSLQKSLGIAYNNSGVILNSINDAYFNMGDWYISRLYALYSGVFRLNEWKERLNEDLEDIEKEQTFATELINTIHSNMLEYIVILLIFIEVAIEIISLIK